MKRNQPKQQHSFPIPTMPHLMLNYYDIFIQKITIFQWSSDNICLHRNRLVTFCSLWYVIKHMCHCGNINTWHILYVHLETVAQKVLFEKFGSNWNMDTCISNTINLLRNDTYIYVQVCITTVVNIKTYN